MVFNVHESEINSVIALHYASVSSGGLFISDQANPSSHRPDYFDLLKNIVGSNTLSRSISCGCQDTDECQATACGANTAPTQTAATLVNVLMVLEKQRMVLALILMSVPLKRTTVTFTPLARTQKAPLSALATRAGLLLGG